MRTVSGEEKELEAGRAAKEAEVADAVRFEAFRVGMPVVVYEDKDSRRKYGNYAIIRAIEDGCCACEYLSDNRVETGLKPSRVIADNTEEGHRRWLQPNERPFDLHDPATWSADYKQWRLNGGGDPASNLVFVTLQEARADLRVYVTTRAEDADVKVYKVSTESHANQGGHWYFCENEHMQREGTVKRIFLTKDANQADKTICFVEHAHEAGGVL